MAKFVCERISSNNIDLSLIDNFVIDREKDFPQNPNEIIGLEQYLKYYASPSKEEKPSGALYLIKDAAINMIAAYFGLQAGAVPLCIECSHDLLV